MIGHTYERDFKSMVINNMIQNFHITASDVTNSHTMFDPNLAGTRLNKVQQNLYRVVMYYVAVPRDFLKLHNFVTLVPDVIFLNNLPLLITMARGINFVTVERVPTRTDNQLSKYLIMFVGIYSISGMVIQTVLMDM